MLFSLKDLCSGISCRYEACTTLLGSQGTRSVEYRRPGKDCGLCSGWKIAHPQLLADPAHPRSDTHQYTYRIEVQIVACCGDLCNFLTQDTDSEALQNQLKQEEQLKGKKADDKARVDTLSVNINYWKRHAADRHECYTCRRHLDAAEEQRFMQIQVTCMAALKKGSLPSMQ